VKPKAESWESRYQTLRQENEDRRHRIAELEAEVERERIERGRQGARCGVFMQSLASLARRCPAEHEWAKQVVIDADAASAQIRIEDFVRVQLNAARAKAEEK
jgi:hypothetical protein